MRSASVLALGLFIASSPAAFAYTQDEASACTPDAFRFCQAAIPDARRVGDCLYHFRAQLSPACAAVFGRYVRQDSQRRRTLAVDSN